MVYCYLYRYLPIKGVCQVMANLVVLIIGKGLEFVEVTAEVVGALSSCVVSVVSLYPPGIYLYL